MGNLEKQNNIIQSIRGKISDKIFTTMLEEFDNILDQDGLNQDGLNYIMQIISIVEDLKIQGYNNRKISWFIDYYHGLLKTIKENINDYRKMMRITDKELEEYFEHHSRVSQRAVAWEVFRNYPVLYDILADTKDRSTKSKYRFQWLERTDPETVRTIWEHSKDDILLDSSVWYSEDYNACQKERQEEIRLVVLSVKDKKGRTVGAGTVCIDGFYFQDAKYYRDEDKDGEFVGHLYKIDKDEINKKLIEVMRFEFSNYFKSQEDKQSEYEKLSIYSKFIEGLYAFQKEFNSQSPEEVYKRIIVRDKDLCVDTSELTPTNGSRVTAYGYGYNEVYDIKDIDALVKAKLKELRPKRSKKTISPDEAASSLARKGIGKLSKGVPKPEEEQKDKDLTGEE